MKKSMEEQEDLFARIDTLCGLEDEAVAARQERHERAAEDAERRRIRRAAAEQGSMISDLFRRF